MKHLLLWAVFINSFFINSGYLGDFQYPSFVLAASEMPNMIAENVPLDYLCIWGQSHNRRSVRETSHQNAQVL